jgi:hypothetical protein
VTVISWFNLEFWGPVWPNLAASAVTFTSGWLWAKRRMLAELDRRDKIHAAHHAKTHALVQSLHEQVASLTSPGDQAQP